jgi:hypothetical protein
MVTWRTIASDAYYAERASGHRALIKDEYWGDRVFSLRDPTGYMLTMCKTVKQMSMENRRFCAAASGANFQGSIPIRA